MGASDNPAEAVKRLAWSITRLLSDETPWIVYRQFKNHAKIRGLPFDCDQWPLGVLQIAKVELLIAIAEHFRKYPEKGGDKCL
jgi:hypothetical protein